MGWYEGKIKLYLSMCKYTENFVLSRWSYMKEKAP